MPAGDRLSWFRFNPQDHISDPAVRAMSYEEQGRYWQVICTLYLKNSAKATEAQIRTWATYTETEWMEHRDSLARAFQVKKERGGVYSWMHKRVRLEIAAAQGRVKKARKSGSAGARARWGSMAVLSRGDG